ncbi:flagellar assembly protein FliX [Phenylobacterium sp.]|uniref:flagellar assembly regulator FliX n=1 Tax=Phenylobacterium sp. TaxID=1871053 RepID=UPI00272FE893|nr:flagellar assembly protein FliX [Phenylobacterium sp.]MDP2212370.1 flagellar assembly protein FliX [Phenylobacterium sp.]
MKVTGSGSAGSTSGAGRAKGASGGGVFQIPTASGAAPAAAAGPAAAVASVGGLSALLALQEAGGPLERRRRAVSRAGRILDVLDEVKLALISGELSLGQLERLTRAVREERAATEDAALEGVLNEIETRAAVELAKLEMARNAGLREAVESR